jgi:hypothetical protein
MDRAALKPSECCIRVKLLHIDQMLADHQRSRCGRYGSGRRKLIATISGGRAHRAASTSRPKLRFDEIIDRDPEYRYILAI